MRTLRAVNSLIDDLFERKYRKVGHEKNFFFFFFFFLKNGTFEFFGGPRWEPRYNGIRVIARGVLTR